MRVQDLERWVWLDDVQQPFTDFRAGRREIDGYKSYRMSLDDRRFIDIFLHGWVQQ